jgi:nuclease HARBI1
MSAMELFDMVRALDIPEKLVTPSRYAFSGIEGLALLCARFRSAGEMYTLSMLYDRSQSSMSDGNTYSIATPNTYSIHRN